jgi:hypothetical protein
MTGRLDAEVRDRLSHPEGNHQPAEDLLRRSFLLLLLASVDTLCMIRRLSVSAELVSTKCAGSAES